MSAEPGTGASDRPALATDLEAVYRSSGAALWRAVYAFAGGNRSLADDVVAEAFTRALASRTELRDPLAWLYRTAFRIAAAELRAERRLVAPIRASPVDPPAEPIEVVAALRALSPSQRAAVVLHHVEDLPVRDVAHRMGSSVTAVKVHLFRGRRRLRELLGSEEIEDA